MKTPLHLEISPHEHVIVDTSGARLADVRGFDGDPDGIVRRCNAFDELLNFVRLCALGFDDPHARALIAKYEAPSTENRAP